MKRKLILCVFIDALGWELAKRHAFLDDVLVVKSPLNTIFGYSSTCDPTILTGLMPREHGHFAFYAYDPANSPFKRYRYFRLLPKALMERGRLRAKLSRIMKRVHKFTGYFQLYNMPFGKLHLFNYMERNDIFEPGGINRGQPTIFDYLRENKISYCRPKGFDESTSVRQVEQAIARSDVRFAYLFLGRLDAILHQYGTEAEEVGRHIAWYEAKLRRLYDLAQEKYEAVHIHVFSDHGMTDIHEICDVKSSIEGSDLRFGDDYAAVYDSTMARFWFLKPGARERIVELLSEEPLGHIMTEEELAGYGCDFPQQEYGELFFLANPGVLICPSHMGVKPLAGMHGFAPEDKDSMAVYMSNVSAEPAPKGLQDLYGLMRNEVSGEVVEG